MIDPGLIEQLIKVLDESDIDSLEIQRGGTRIRLGKTPLQPLAAPTAAISQQVQEAPLEAPTPVSEVPGSSENESSGLIEITSPMVGTFYSGPTPGAPPFTEVGAKVSPGDELCIIEAMKLMNELEAEVAGTVVEICAENAQPVEFGQVLFIVDPA